MSRTELLVEAMLWLMSIALFIALVTVAWSVIRSLRFRKISLASNSENAVARYLALAIMAGTVVLLILSFALASTTSLPVSGNGYSNAFWLRMAGMSITSTTVLLLVAVMALFYDKMRRHNGRGNENGRMMKMRKP